jgi:hypothetical protein
MRRADVPRVLSENIDRLCTVEIRPREGHVARDVVRRLYDAARTKTANLPLTYQAAKVLLDSSPEKSYVFILAGSGAPPRNPKGEVDGMLGAAALARVLDFGLGVKPVLVTEERHRDPLVAATHAAGVPVLSRAVVERRRFGAIFEPFPESEEEARSCSEQLFRDYKPRGVIAIEKQAPNKKGFYHTIGGIHRDVETFAWVLIETARSENVPSIGIGDGGNEIGFGAVADAVEEIMPYGRMCQCPCEGGIASRVATDYLVVASISNWGAYGICASLAAQLGDLDIFPAPSTVRRMLVECVGAGAMDGDILRPDLSDDGVPLKTHESIVRILRSIITIGSA